MSRSNPNILISGTPGVGKSCLATLLAQKSGLTLINVGQFAKENNCLGAWDEEYLCHELDEDKVLDLLEEKQKPGGLIFEHHVPDLFPERWFDIVFVLRTDNSILYDRLSARGYTGKKLEENIQAYTIKWIKEHCEIFQTILDEAKASYREELVHELPSNTQEDQESNCARILQWIQAWHQDRNKKVKMVTVAAEALMKLETRAVAAEKLIQLLRSQIKACKDQQANGSKAPSSEILTLREENNKLKQEISTWITKLNDAERKNGKKTFFTGTPVVCEAKAASPLTNIQQEKPSEVKSEAAGDKPEKKEKPKKEKKSGGGGGQPAEPELPIDIGRLDLRVGHIRSAKKHPDADSLYVEEVDVGEEKPRTVISGLVKFIPEDQMQDRMAVLLCNLKPSKMRGIMSEAMVMCASTPEKVEILSPPAGCKPGDPVQVEGYTRNPDAQLNPKKKIFETCAPDLKVNGDKEACYKGVKWTVNGEPVKSQTLTDVIVK